MAITVSVKDFNVDKLREELASLLFRGLHGLGLFVQVNVCIRHSPKDSRVVGTSSSDGDDVALRGELRFFSPSTLTDPQNTSLGSVLADHNSVTPTAEQVRQDQDTNDLDALLATDRPVYLNHIQSSDGLSTANKLVAAKAMFIIIGKVLRLFIRKSRGGANI
jgi:hypothetical protein